MSLSHPSFNVMEAKADASVTLWKVLKQQRHENERSCT